MSVCMNTQNSVVFKGRDTKFGMKFTVQIKCILNVWCHAQRFCKYLKKSIITLINI